MSERPGREMGEERKEEAPPSFMQWLLHAGCVHLHVLQVCAYL